MRVLSEDIDLVRQAMELFLKAKDNADGRGLAGVSGLFVAWLSKRPDPGFAWAHYNILYIKSQELLSHFIAVNVGRTAYDQAIVDAVADKYMQCRHKLQSQAEGPIALDDVVTALDAVFAKFAPATMEAYEKVAEDASYDPSSALLTRKGLHEL